jgi:hypothetical protein
MRPKHVAQKIKAHYNKGKVNRVVLDHVSTYKLNLIYYTEEGGFTLFRGHEGP